MLPIDAAIGLSPPHPLCAPTMRTPITLALPKGRILKEALPLLAQLGIVPEADFSDEGSR